VREEIVSLRPRYLFVPQSGAVVEIAEPEGAPFDLAAVMSLADDRIAVQWAAPRRDHVAVLGPGGATLTSRTFDWSASGHGVIRGLATNRGRLGLLVEDPSGSVMELHLLEPAGAENLRVALPRPLSLLPCTRERSNDDVTLVDAWLTLTLTAAGAFSTHATTIEIGARGSCVREVRSLPSADGDEPSSWLEAVDGRALEGHQIEGSRRRTVSCVQLGAAPPTATGPAAGAACANVSIGLDLRALPTNSSTGGIDMFVGAQADDFVDAAGPGARPEIRSQSGLGGFDATFRGATPAAVMARCQSTVRAYLASAPRLPIIMAPAATITQQCRLCP
jgi:hypothetical protein